MKAFYLLSRYPYLLSPRGKGANVPLRSDCFPDSRFSFPQAELLRRYSRLSVEDIRHMEHACFFTMQTALAQLGHMDTEKARQAQKQLKEWCDVCAKATAETAPTETETARKFADIIKASRPGLSALSLQRSERAKTETVEICLMTIARTLGIEQKLGEALGYLSRRFPDGFGR